jgi:hypothetical protein
MEICALLVLMVLLMMTSMIMLLIMMMLTTIIALLCVLHLTTRRYALQALNGKSKWILITGHFPLSNCGHIHSIIITISISIISIISSSLFNHCR